MKKKVAQYQADNLQAAIIINSEADFYGGDTALAVIWARKILTDEQQAQPQRAA